MILDSLIGLNREIYTKSAGLRTHMLVAGAAAQFHKGALLVNPYHTEVIADVIKQAFYMPVKKRKIRMQRLRQNILKYDIFWWVD